MNATIKSIGMYIPERQITNAYFESILDTSDDWITSRTGIKTRYFAEPDEYTSDLCIKAVDDLIEKFGQPIQAVDFIIVATSTPDHAFPSTASRVQQHYGIPNAGCLDISAACAGFVYALILAKGLIAAGTHKRVLVIGAETLSKVCDFTDRTTSILFGDGASAVLVEESEENYLYDALTATDGSYGKDLYISSFPMNGETIINDGKIHQNGRTVFKWAVNTLTEKVKELASANQTTVDKADWLIPHSANLRILEAVCSALDFPIEKCLESVRNYGNTSAASIPIAWYTGLMDGKIRKGDKLLLAGFGGGLTFAGIYLENQIQLASKCTKAP